MSFDFGVFHRRRILTRGNGRRQRGLRLSPTDIRGVWVIVSAMTFAARLTEARERLGLNQAQLAKLAGVTGAWVSKAEAGLTADVHSKTLFAVCRVLQVNPEWLAEGSGPRDAIHHGISNAFAELSPEQQAVVRSVIESLKK